MLNLLPIEDFLLYILHVHKPQPAHLDDDFLLNPSPKLGPEDEKYVA